MVIISFFAKLVSILTSLGQPVLAWITSHQAQIQQAIKDLEAGAPLTQVFADLFAKTGLQVPKKAVQCEDCCKTVCCSSADAIKAIHSGDMDCTINSLATALGCVLGCPGC